MIDYSYVECSSAAVCALAALAKQFPSHRAAEVRRAVERGRGFVRAVIRRILAQTR